jgi:hypothetical protein
MVFSFTILPSAVHGALTAGFASGTLTFSNSNTFSLDVLVGSGRHDFAEFEAAGHRVTAATLEPATLTVGAIGLLGAALLRRQRQASSPLPHDA